jgi:hypothetical protein
MQENEKDSGIILNNLLFIGGIISLVLLSKYIEPQFSIYAAFLTAIYTFIILGQLINALDDRPKEPANTWENMKNTLIKKFNDAKKFLDVKVSLAALSIFIIIFILEVLSLYILPISDSYINLFYDFTLILVIILWSSFVLVLLILAIKSVIYLYDSKIKKRDGLRKPMFSFCGVIIILLFVLTALTPEITKSIAVDHYAKSGYFEDILYKINENNPDDISKIQAILKWQNENMHNEFQNTFMLLPTTLCITKSPPYTLFLRTSGAGYPNPEWALISKYGACGEASQAFMELASMSNITVRCISLKGEDHGFDEVYTNGAWITVDAVGAVNGWENLGYDMPSDTYQEGWKYDIVMINAFYPNDTSEDITYNSPYTKVYNLTIYAVDGRNRPISNATVWIYPDNEQHINQNIHKTVNIKNLTDYNGICSFTLGQNNYTIETNKDFLFFNRTNITLSGEDKNKTVVLKFLSNS